MLLRSGFAALLLLLLGCEKIPFFKKPESPPPPQAGLWYHYGTLHHSIGEFHDAAEAYQLAVKLRPDFFEAWHQLHLVSQSEGKTDEQIHALQEAVRLKPQSAEVWNALAEVYSRTGKNAEAIQARQQEEIAKQQPKTEAGDLEAATRVQPNSAENWLALAYYQLLSRGQQPEHYATTIENNFQQIAQLTPQDSNAWIHLGLAQIRRSDPPAIAIGEERPTRVNLEPFQKAIQLAPQDPLAHFFLGRALLWEKQPKEASEALQKAVSLDPAPSLPWYFLGEALRLNRKPTEALAAYLEALQRTPQRSEILYGISMAHVSLLQLPEAITAFEKASASRPPPKADDPLASTRDIKRTQAQRSLQVVLKTPAPAPEPPPQKPIEEENLTFKPPLLPTVPPQKSVPEAEKESLTSLLQKTLEFPKDVRNWKKLYALQEAGNSLAEMTETAMRIVALEPTATNWSLLAYTFGLQDRREEEIKAYLKSLQKDPDQTTVLQNLGLAWLEFKKPEKAQEVFQKWTQLEPAEPDAWYQLGLAADESKHFEQAEIAYQKTVVLDPKNASAWMNLGTVYGEMKKRDKEIECYQKAVEVDPGYASAWHNLSVALRQSGEIPKAEAARKEFERLKK